MNAYEKRATEAFSKVAGEQIESMIKFEMNGKGLGIDGSVFETDAETLEVLCSIIPSAMTSGDASAVYAMMFFGLKAGIIRKVS